VNDDVWAVWGEDSCQGRVEGCCARPHALAGEAVLAQGDLAEAVRRLAQGLTLGQTVGDRTALTWCLAGLGSYAGAVASNRRSA
jgi:hypothetical protein